MLSSGASTTALEHYCGRRTAVVCSQWSTTVWLSWLSTIANRFCCEKVERSRVVEIAPQFC